MSMFLHDNKDNIDDTKAIAIPRIFFKGLWTDYYMNVFRLILQNFIDLKVTQPLTGYTEWFS